MSSSSLMPCRYPHKNPVELPSIFNAKITSKKFALFFWALEVMRVPVCSPQSNHSPAPSSAVSGKLISDPNGNSNWILVSDPHHHRHQAALEWDENVVRNMDWDDIVNDLGLDDELTSPELTHHPLHLYESYSGLNHQNPSPDNYFDPNTGNFNLGFEFDVIEELIRAAECFETQELQLAGVISARLNQRLPAPIGKPLQRAAFYFNEALQSLLTEPTRPIRSSSWSEIVQTIKAYKSFSEINPIPMFNHFTTNQALLEALDDGSAPLIHIIDFDIGFGGQYASLMREMAERNDQYSRNFIRITAVVPEEYVFETRLIKDILSQFAQELGLRFQIEFVLLPTFQALSFKAFKFITGEKTAILLSPAVFRYQCLNVTTFVSDLRRVNPSVVMVVDGELWMESGMKSFRKNFVKGLEFYAVMFESLDAAGGEWARKVETLLLRQRIFSAVESASRGTAPAWREVFRGAGMRAVRLSQLADFQAESLLLKVKTRGFHVARRQAELVLCWDGTALSATSAWRC
ncbi:hypothetical protein V6N13_024167 [Hibiscus sabdariffa]